MASTLYPHMGFLLVMFWALSALAHRLEIVRQGKKGISAAAILAVSFSLSFTPIAGLSFSGFVLSFIPVFSSGSLFIATMFLIKLYKGRNPIKEREWTVLIMAGGLYTLTLMVSALGILPFDLYSAGYGEIWFLGLLALSAGALALWGSVLTWWLIAAPALWWIEAVPSGNINDTLTDFFFLVLCLVLLTRKLLGLRKPKGV